MFVEIYNVIVSLLFGTAELTAFQLLFTNCLAYFCCAVAVVLPIYFVVKVFTWVGYSLRLK